MPDLPADATEWKVTSVEFSLAKSGSPNQTLFVRLYLPDGSHMPTTLIDSVSVAESELPTSQTWYTIEFAGHSGLDPTQGICIALECETSAAAAWLHFHTSGDTDPNSDMIRGSQAGGWTSYQADQALVFKLHGTYKSSELAVAKGTWRRDAAP